MIVQWLRARTGRRPVAAAVLEHHYPQADATEGPYIVSFLAHDPEDPKQFSACHRWLLCGVAGYTTFSVAFISSAYASGVPQIAEDLHITPETATLGLSLFVFGFCLGPLVWAPASEAIGRQPVLYTSTLVHVLLNVAVCFSPNATCLLLLRLLSGAFGAAPLTNSGGIIADTFPPETRGHAITVYALVPLFAPVLGPIVGGSIAQHLGWRSLMGLMAILSTAALLLVLGIMPETFAPVLLRRRARRLAHATSKPHISALDLLKAKHAFLPRSLATTLARPWQLAMREPIVALLALYQAIIFGTLYMTFAAFPLVYARHGWSQSKAGLSFLGLFVGTLSSVVFELWNNRRYTSLLAAGGANPETRLDGCCIGAVSLFIGLLWFTLAVDASIPAFVSIAAGVPFGFGIVLITIGSTNYLVDSYTFLAASALTVCIVTRALFAAVFPFSTRWLFHTLGVQGTMAVPTAFALLFLPFPFVFRAYGAAIRTRCPYACEAQEFTRTLQPPTSTEHTRLLQEA